MDTLLLDLSTLAAALGVLLLCGVGIAALPWRDAELLEALSALRAVPGVVRAVLPTRRAHPAPRRWSGSAPAH